MSNKKDSQNVPLTYKLVTNCCALRIGYLFDKITCSIRAWRWLPFVSFSSGKWTNNRQQPPSLAQRVKQSVATLLEAKHTHTRQNVATKRVDIG